jgi:hypothetical protein
VGLLIPAVRLEGRQRHIGIGADQRQEDVHQGHTVAQAVMHPPDQDAFRTVVLGIMYLPQRPAQIERGAGQQAHEFLQGGLVPRRWQASLPEMVAQIEIAIVLPTRWPPGKHRLDDPLPEPRETQKTSLEGQLQTLIVYRRRQDHDPCSMVGASIIVCAKHQRVYVCEVLLRHVAVFP